MADAWELILHHNYASTPGVIFDDSPRRLSHGVAVGLEDSNFVHDGAQAGSGAINFPTDVLVPEGSINVAQSDCWVPLKGLRVEIVCRRDRAPMVPEAIGHLIESDSFSFQWVLAGKIHPGVIYEPVRDFGHIH